MRLCRTVVFTNLGRPRLGLSEREVARSLRPTSSALLAIAGMGFKNSGPGDRGPRAAIPTGGKSDGQ
jgi:hypothetical protein